MKVIGVIRTSVLISLLGTSALIYAQDQRDEAKPPQDQPRPEATNPAKDKDKDEVKPPRQDEAKAPKQDEVKPPREDNKPAERQDETKPARQAEQNGQQAQHEQRANNQHGRIPDDKFRANFGRQHTVVINRPTIVEGHPRFQYSGYWFTIVDVWPADWAYTDDCYIDYVDGEYFLFDLSHPGVRIAISVVL
jgi:hypothetical protein